MTRIIELLAGTEEDELLNDGPCTHGHAVFSRTAKAMFGAREGSFNRAMQKKTSSGKCKANAKSSIVEGCVALRDGAEAC